MSEISNDSVGGLDFEPAKQKRQTSRDALAASAARASLQSVNSRIGSLQRSAMHLRGRATYERNNDAALAAAVAMLTAEVVRTQAELDFIVSTLPADVAANSRVADSRQSLTMMRELLASLSEQKSEIEIVTTQGSYGEAGDGSRSS